MEQNKPTQVELFKNFNQTLTNERTMDYLRQVLGAKASQFVNNVTALVANDTKLQACKPMSIVYAAIKATALDLPLDPSLGFAYVIPYNNKNQGAEAQFQLGYKGFIQLAIRSGQFQRINVTDVREGELASHDRMTGDITYNWMDDSVRSSKPIIGFAAYFRLNNGFDKSLYMSAAEIENLLSNYIIDSWSYSKVSAFRQNEARFQMQYIYLAPLQRSISSIAGNAYHEALKVFFLGFNAGATKPDVDELVTVANNYIDDIDPSVIELTSKVTTAEDAVLECKKNALQLITFFCCEYEVYTANIDKVLQVEEKSKAWVVVNGVSIPLPLHFIVDLVVRTKDGKNVVIDHKSKRSFTDAEEAVDVYCDQAMTYVLGLEATSDLHIDEAWFIEAKTSKNRDGSSQLCKHVITMSDEMRGQCEAELYQPLKRMINALSDPDYYYMYNPGDMLIDHKAMKEFRREKQLDTKHPVLAPQVVDYIERRNKRAAALADAGQKVVYQYAIDGTLVRAWSSVREAEHELGYSRAQIQRVCNGKRKTCGGYIWTYNSIA